MRWLIIVCLFLVCSAAAAQEDGADRTFGVVEAYYRPEEAAELGATWERIIFAWDCFQPRGERDFVTTCVPQEYLDNAAAANREIVGLIKGTPAWASDSGSPGAVPDGLELPFDDRDNLFGAFVTRLAAYYGTRGIHNWIILNEPDIRQGEGIVEFDGEVADYANLLKVAYRAIKTEDAQAHIQIAGMTWWYDRTARRVPYLRRLLSTLAADPDAAANNNYFDGITLHIYFTTWTVWPILMANVEILREFGLQQKDIWLAEFNASPRRDPEARIETMFNVSLEQQADFIVQASAIALAAGVDRMAVYRLYDNDFVPGVQEPWGLVRTDGSLRPAFYSYQQVIARFTGARSIQRFTIPEAELITFSFPERTVYAMWSSGFTGGDFLINMGNAEDAVIVSNAAGEEEETPLEEDGGVNLAVIDAPPAERIDLPWVVVAGPVRLVEIAGAPRTVWYRGEGGAVTQVR
jgi:hypothetical protein